MSVGTETTPGFPGKTSGSDRCTIVDDSTDAKQLDAVIREKNLTTLRVSKAPPELRQKFHPGGVPDTYVIDEAGIVRIADYSAVPDVSRYFEADLEAITEAGPAKPSANAEAN